MPKLPRGTGKATTKERAKKPAAKAAPAKRAPAKKANGAGASGSTTKKKPATTRSNGTTAKTRARAKPKPPPDLDFRHRPVDSANVHAPVGPTAKLTDGQRRLL